MKRARFTEEQIIGVADAVLAAQFGNRDAALVLLQNADDLFFAETTALHVLVLSMGQNELQTGLNSRGNVTTQQKARDTWCVAGVGF